MTIAMTSANAWNQKNEPHQHPSRKARYHALVARHLDNLYGYAYWLSGDRSLAEDIVQDTMLRAWRSIDQFQEPKAAKGWLMTILRREIARRFESVQPRDAGIPVEALSEKDRDYDTSTEAFVVRRALAHLPANLREPLLMQIVYGYSLAEIAEQLGLTEAGAGTRLFRARQKLNELVEGALQ